MADENDQDKDTKTPTPTPTTTHTDDDVQRQLAEMREAIKKANAQALTERKKREELEKLEEERKAGDLSELERTKKAASHAEQARKDAEERANRAAQLLADTRIDHAIERAAATMDPPFQYPHSIPRLVNRAKIGYDAETETVDKATVQKELDRLAKEMPGLLKAPPGRGSPNRDTPPRPANAGARGNAANGRRQEDEQEVDLHAEMYNQGGYET